MSQTQIANEAVSSDAKEISVSELALELKRSLEERFGYVRVRGEIYGYRGLHSSGHAYFSLKDETARIDAVIWRSTVLRLRTKPEEGLEVIAFGKLTTFPSKSTYQIVVESLQPAGVGALIALLEARRRKLAAEGIFDVSRKRALPFLPRVIGVVTSPTGSVIRDIIHRVADRFPSRVVVWPVRVQGEGSADEIVAAIRGLNALSDHTEPPRPDVLIVARGGGALEDLWTFNEEAVVRAAAESEIPLISAVGHETDWTLLDQVSDVRAPTPTAAAEICIPIRADLVHRSLQAKVRTEIAINRIKDQNGTALRMMERAFPPVSSLILNLEQRGDNLNDALRARIRASLDYGAISLSNRGGRLSWLSPIVLIISRRQCLQAVEGRRAFAMQSRVNQAREAMREQLSAFRYMARRCAESWRQGLQRVGQQWTLKWLEAMRSGDALRGELDRNISALRRAVRDSLRHRSMLNSKSAELFSAINYKSVLERGFALVFDSNGALLSRAEQARVAGKIAIQFADEKLAASVGSPRNRKRVRSVDASHQQGNLFQQSTLE